MDIQSYARYQHGKTRNEILQCLCHGRCCILLGFPGSGKTVMTADLVKTLICDHRKRVAVTGSTGSAAQQIKALLPEMDITVQTAHSFLGFRQKESSMIDKGDLEKFEKHMKQQFALPWKQEARETIKQCDVLILDEMSMLTGEFIQAMDISLRVARHSPSKSFGGLTLLLIGDYRQLPPVSKSIYQYSFQHPNWQNWFERVFSLEFILRQAGDMPYSEMILRLSHNSMTQSDIGILSERVVSDGRDKIMSVTFLPDALRVFHTNKDVNIYNDAITAKAVLEGMKSVKLPTKIDVPNNLDYKKEVAQLFNDMVFSNEIFVGSHVIITANINVSSGIVNGTMGRVTDIERNVSMDIPIYGGRELSVIVTLRLSDERTVRLGCHSISISKENNFKQQTSHLQPKDIIKAFYMPLLLSHAITVHRLQGSTISRPLFYKPQNIGRYCREFYVILSRVTSLDYLYLTNLPYNLSGVVDPTVIDMYQRLFQEVKK